MKPTISEIQEILAIFLDSDLQELRLEIGDVRVAVSRNGSAPMTMSPQPVPRSEAPTATPSPAAVSAAPTPAPVSAAPQPATEPNRDNGHWVAVTAPSLGLFYRKPAPDQPPFVEVGDLIDHNAPVCLIEVMKMYSQVTSPSKGRIAKILVEDGTLVEFGQTLMYIDPA